jgi:hypothetical protein
MDLQFSRIDHFSHNNVPPNTVFSIQKPFSRILAMVFGPCDTFSNYNFKFKYNFRIIWTKKNNQNFMKG